MTDAREIIAHQIPGSSAEICFGLADAIIASLTASGHIITTRAAIDAEIAEARKEAFEEAAKVAERAGDTWSYSRDVTQCAQEAAVDEKCEEISSAIRALAAKGGET